MVRVYCLILTVLLLAPGTAQAGKLARAQLPPGPVHVDYTGCPTGGGQCSDPDTGTIYLTRPADPFARAHELGHIFDARVLTDTTRARFTRLLAFPAGEPWRSPEGCALPVCPSEIFADAYATCRLRMHPERYHGIREWVVSYGYMPTARQHRRVCRAMARVRTPARVPAACGSSRSRCPTTNRTAR